MMYGELYQYLIQHKQLAVPRIGTFLLERKPAVADFPNRIIHAPTYSVVLQQHNSTSSKKFFNWLGYALGISDREAVVRFNDFAFELRQKIGAGDTIHWDGVGVIKQGLTGEILFEAELQNTFWSEPVKFEKVIRNKGVHFVSAGEDERTSDQVLELAEQSSSQKSYWWAWALVAGFLTIMFIGWYFSEHGIGLSATGHNEKVKAEQTTGTYRKAQ